MAECSKIATNMSHCNCSYDPCPRKGKCCECLQYHLAMKQLPACAFPDDAEKTYDRSFRKFVEVCHEKYGI